MKRILIDSTLAVLLTFPIYLGLANNPAINDWFLYGSAWAAFQPLFDMGNAIGIHRQAAIVIGTMFVVSYALSLISITAIRRAARGLATRTGAQMDARCVTGRTVAASGSVHP